MADPRPQRTGLAIVPLLVRGVVAIVLIVIAMGFATMLFATRPEAPRHPKEAEARPVRIVTAQAFDVPRVWEGYATARAVREATVAAEVSGRIVERPDAIQGGRWVEPGDLLARLDDRELVEQQALLRESIAALEASLDRLTIEVEQVQEALAKAQEAIAITKEELRLMQQAGSRGGASPIEIERLKRELTTRERDAITLRERADQVPLRRVEIKSQIAADQARLRIADLNVERATIVAPIEGILQEVFVDTGDRVAIGSSIARIIDPRRIEAPISLAISAARDVRVGDPASFVASSAAGGTPVEGRIARILPEADASARSITVVIEAEQAAAPGELPAVMPGAFVLGSVTTQSDRVRVIVPRKAVQDDRVLVVNSEGRIEAQTVDVWQYVVRSFPSVEPTVREWAVLEGGVEAGARIVISNLDELQPGAKVRESEDEGEPPAFARNGGAPPAPEQGATQ